MDEISLARESMLLIAKDLGLSETLDIEKANDPFEELHSFLTRQIQYLLDHDFSRLLNAMYRIDISEKKFKQTLELAEPGKIASALSYVVIEREKAKIITREKYSFSQRK